MLLKALILLLLDIYENKIYLNKLKIEIKCENNDDAYFIGDYKCYIINKKL